MNNNIPKRLYIDLITALKQRAYKRVRDTIISIKAIDKSISVRTDTEFDFLFTDSAREIFGIGRGVLQALIENKISSQGIYAYCLKAASQPKKYSIPQLKNDLINSISRYAFKEILDVLWLWNKHINAIPESILNDEKKAYKYALNILNTSEKEASMYSNNNVNFRKFLIFTSKGRLFQKSINFNGEARIIVFKLISSSKAKSIKNEIWYNGIKSKIILTNNSDKWMPYKLNTTDDIKWLPPSNHTIIDWIYYNDSIIEIDLDSFSFKENIPTIYSRYKKIISETNNGEKIMEPLLFGWTRGKWKAIYSLDLFGVEKREYIPNLKEQPKFEIDSMVIYEKNIYKVVKISALKGVRYLHLIPCRLFLNNSFKANKIKTVPSIFCEKL